jgi:hypothetical protein
VKDSKDPHEPEHNEAGPFNSAYLKVVAVISRNVGPIRTALLVVGGIGAAVTCVALRVSKSLVPLWAFLGFLLVLVLVLVLLSWWPPPDPSDPDRDRDHVEARGVPEGRQPRPALSEDQVPRIHRALTTAADEIARNLRIKPIEDVRACLFCMSPDGYLRMIRDVSIRMTPDELTIKMPAGYGITGQAFADGQPRIGIDPQPNRVMRFLLLPWTIARVFVDNDGRRPSTSSIARGPWYLEASEAAKLQHRLSWIISVPIPRMPDQPRWVMNIDGLQRRSEKHLQQQVVGRLLNWGRLLEELLQGTPGQRSSSELRR